MGPKVFDFGARTWELQRGMRLVNRALSERYLPPRWQPLDNYREKLKAALQELMMMQPVRYKPKGEPPVLPSIEEALLKFCHDLKRITDQLPVSIELRPDTYDRARLEHLSYLESKKLKLPPGVVNSELVLYTGGGDVRLIRQAFPGDAPERMGLRLR